MKGVLKVSENHVIEMSGRKLTKKPCNSLLFFELQGFVEIPRFELGQTEPKSVVLPLHHVSIKGYSNHLNIIKNAKQA